MFEHLLRMESNTPEINPLQDDVQNAIESLRSTLNNNYLTAEKLMSLRNPEIKSLNESVAKVEDSYNELNENNVKQYDTCANHSRCSN